MKRILFVCHGNICRSPMAEYIMKNYIRKYHLEGEIYCESMATSSEELGNDIYPPVKDILRKYKIPFDNHKARKIYPNIINEWDLILGMDSYNISNIKRILGESNKIHKLSEFSGSNIDIDDPWYTRDFENCYQEINIHINNLIKKILSKIDNN